MLRVECGPSLQSEQATGIGRMRSRGISQERAKKTVNDAESESRSFTTRGALRSLVADSQNSTRGNHDRHAACAVHGLYSDDHRRPQSANRLELAKVSEVAGEPRSNALEDACPVVERHRYELTLPDVKGARRQFSAAKNDLTRQGQRDRTVLADAIGDLHPREFRHHIDRCRLSATRRWRRHVSEDGADNTVQANLALVIGHRRARGSRVGRLCRERNAKRAGRLDQPARQHITLIPGYNEVAIATGIGLSFYDSDRPRRDRETEGLAANVEQRLVFEPAAIELFAGCILRTVR